MQLQESSWLHNTSGMLCLARIIQLEERQKKKEWLHQGKRAVGEEKNVLK